MTAVIRIRIHTTVFFHSINKVIFGTAIHDRFCNCTGHYSVICKKAIVTK